MLFIGPVTQPAAKIMLKYYILKKILIPFCYSPSVVHVPEYIVAQRPIGAHVEVRPALQCLPLPLPAYCPDVGSSREPEA